MYRLPVADGWVLALEGFERQMAQPEGLMSPNMTENCFRVMLCSVTADFRNVCLKEIVMRFAVEKVS